MRSLWIGFARLVPVWFVFFGCVSCERESAVPASVPEPNETPKKVTPVSKRKAGPVENIDTSERIAAASLTIAVDPVAQEIRVFQAVTRGAFDEKRFGDLETVAAELRKADAVFRDGSWKSYQFYEAIDNRFHWGEDGFLTDLETFQAWETAFPESITQRIALAKFLVSYAWHARGSGYADAVTEEGWKRFGARLKKADEVLKSVMSGPEKDPYAWVVALDIARGLGPARAEFDRLVAEARSAAPQYWHVETRMAFSLIPRWYGKEGDWEAFAPEASKQENGLGAEVYARIVISLADYYADVFRDAKDPSWKLTREGLEALRKGYPESVTLENWCAKLGTMGRDQEFAKASFERLGDSFVEEVWSKPEQFVHLRGWARTGKW